MESPYEEMSRLSEAARSQQADLLLAYSKRTARQHIQEMARKARERFREFSSDRDGTGDPAGVASGQVGEGENGARGDNG